MTFVGCDLHTRTQQVAVLDTRVWGVARNAITIAHEGDEDIAGL